MSNGSIHPARVVLAEGPLLLCLALAPWWGGATGWREQQVLAMGAAVALGATLLHPDRGLPWRPRTAVGWGVLAAGVLFIAAVVTQHLNPWGRPVLAHEFTTIDPLPHRAWLPSGLDAPVDRVPPDRLVFGNSLRAAVTFGSALLLALAAARVASARDGARRVHLALALSGGVAAALTLGLFAAGRHVPGGLFTEPVFHRVSGPFPYKNLSAAWWIVTLGATLALASGRGGGWRLAAGTGAALHLGAVLVVHSAAGLALAGALATAVVLAEARARGLSRAHGALGIALAFAAAVLALRTVAPVRWTRLMDELRTPVAFVQGGEVRADLHAIARAMGRDRPFFGHGAGSFLFLLHRYKDEVPTWEQRLRRGQPQLNRLTGAVNHADGDWWEFFAEYGGVGVGLLAGGLGLLGAAAWRATAGPLARAPVLAAMLVLAYGLMDTVLRNPAVIGTVAVLLALARPVDRGRKTVDGPEVGGIAAKNA